MRTIPVSIVAASPEDAQAKVLRALARVGLRVKLTNTLAKYPGSQHWHIVMPGAKGTLELTYLPRSGKAWFAIHANREGEWIGKVLPALMAALQEK